MVGGNLVGGSLVELDLEGAERPPAGRRIALVADDHELFRIALSSLLTRRLAFDAVIEAASFDEALERLAETPEVALALFDLGMPGMAGAASLATVRACFPSVRAVVVSGSTRRADILRALEAGVHGYIAKEASAEVLARGLETVVAGQIYVPPFLADLAPDEAPPPEAVATETPPAPGEAALTPRQREILAFVVKGASNKEIARALRLGEGTVKVHVAALFRALGVHNRSSAAVAGTRILAGSP